MRCTLHLVLLACTFSDITRGSPQLLDGLLGGGKPQVKLDYGTFRSNPNLGGGDVNSFQGTPFATAGRLRNPRLLGAADKKQGIQDATHYGPACPQQGLVASGNNAQIRKLLGTIEALVYPPIPGQSEDCVNLNVQMPKGIRAGAKLPVMLWIHGGGFELGSSAALGAEQTAAPGIVYQGANLVARSIEMGQRMVFVSANHRLNVFGTLASQEIADAGVANLLLKDQVRPDTCLKLI